MKDEEIISNSLRQLALMIKKAINDSISSGIIQPEEEPYFRWKVDKFQYTDKGITESSAHSENFMKKSWFRATSKLKESIEKSNEYTLALEHLMNIFGESDKLSQNLKYFVQKLIYKYLSDSRFEEADRDSIIATFLKELREEPIKYGAKVELQGFALRPDSVEIGSDTTLRQPKIEDLEREYPVYIPMILPHLPSPSVILNIGFLGRRANGIQRRVEQAIVILRLFRVGSVKWTSYHMHSESIIDIMASGTLTAGKIDSPLETYLVTQEDEQKLKKFWQTINDFMPRSFFELSVTKTDYLTIAYNRYSDALLQNGILERRIANATMGLEALFLKPDERQELVYRLRTRVSKLLGLLDYYLREIKKIINDAYRIRSIFVHGGQLSYNERKELESKYKDIKNVLQSALDYLRISIILMMLSNKEKDEFIDLIDESLTDTKQGESLAQCIFEAKQMI